MNDVELLLWQEGVIARVAAIEAKLEDLGHLNDALSEENDNLREEIDELRTRLGGKIDDVERDLGRQIWNVEDDVNRIRGDVAAFERAR